MKHLKSSLHDLRTLFGNVICVREITEPLVSFDGNHDAQEALETMKEHNYDVVGVRKGGRVLGYMNRSIGAGPLVEDTMKDFKSSLVIDASESLSRVLERLQDRNFVFVRILGHVGGIVTRGDLQKTPFRMWLFGLISLIEMHLLRVLRRRYPGGDWEKHINMARRKKAMEVYEQRAAKNIECDLADCLQFADKVDALLEDAPFLLDIGFDSKGSARRFFTEIRMLRDDLAHSSDIISPRWPALIRLTGDCERVLSKLELIEST